MPLDLAGDRSRLADVRVLLCHLLALAFVISITGANCCCAKEAHAPATPASCCGEPSEGDGDGHDCACDGQMPMASWDQEWAFHLPEVHFAEPVTGGTTASNLPPAPLCALPHKHRPSGGPLLLRLALLQRYLI
jgi:hypothetical protein